MAQAYTPGLQVNENTIITKIRELPLPGKTLVSIGQKVSPETPVLSAELPGDLSIVQVATRMGFEPAEVSSGIKVKVGDKVEKGDLLCEIKTFFGLFTAKLESPLSGVVEFITLENAHIGFRQESSPLVVNAYINGIVSEINEGKSLSITTDAAFIQGIFGVGGERLGKILLLKEPREKIITMQTLVKYKESLSNAIIIGGAKFDLDALKYAEKQKISAVLTGSIDAETLESFVGSKIGVAITGDELLPFTLIISEGFGYLPISKRIIDLAETLEGENASVNGATQVRAGAMRPEIIVPHADKAVDRSSAAKADSKLQIGANIRIVRVPYFGQLGTITELPIKAIKIDTGAKVRVIRAELSSGETVIIPRANVELLQ